MFLGSVAFLYYNISIRNISYLGFFLCTLLLATVSEIRITLGTPGQKHVCLLLSVSKECLVCVHPLWAPPPPDDTLWLSAWWCFSANSLLFWSTNKSILQGWLQPKFRKRRGEKGVGAYSFWMLSRSLKCHVSATHILYSLTGVH